MYFDFSELNLINAQLEYEAKLIISDNCFQNVAYAKTNAVILEISAYEGLVSKFLIIITSSFV